MAFNEFTIFGNVSKIWVLRTTPGGVPTITFVVTISDERAKGGKGAIDNIPVTTYGDQAIKDAENLKVGMCVGVKGAIRSWYDKKRARGGFNFEAAKNGVLYLGMDQCQQSQAAA